MGPLLRMAFHDAGTFEKASRTGGANGSLRFEVHDPFSAGMEEGFRQLDAVHKKLLANNVPITWVPPPAPIFRLLPVQTPRECGRCTLPPSMCKPSI